MLDVDCFVREHAAHFGGRKLRIDPNAAAIRRGRDRGMRPSKLNCGGDKHAKPAYYFEHIFEDIV